MKAIKDLLQRIRTDRKNRQGTWIGIDESHIILNALEKSERIETENAELRERLEKAVELPSVKRDCELTQIVYRNNYGNIEEETYFHDCYYGQGHDVRGDVYAEARLAELKGGRV